MKYQYTYCLPVSFHFLDFTAVKRTYFFPCPRSNHFSALPAKRLWHYLVKQEYLQDIFIRYIFKKKQPDQVIFSCSNVVKLLLLKTLKNMSQNDYSESSIIPYITRLRGRFSFYFSAIMCAWLGCTIISISLFSTVWWLQQARGRHTWTANENHSQGTRRHNIILRKPGNTDMWRCLDENSTALGAVMLSV